MSVIQSQLSHRRRASRLLRDKGLAADIWLCIVMGKQRDVKSQEMLRFGGKSLTAHPQVPGERVVSLRSLDILCQSRVIRTVHGRTLRSSCLSVGATSAVPSPSVKSGTRGSYGQGCYLSGTVSPTQLILEPPSSSDKCITLWTVETPRVMGISVLHLLLGHPGPTQGRGLQEDHFSASVCQLQNNLTRLHLDNLAR